MTSDATPFIPKGLTRAQMDHRIRATSDNGLSHPEAPVAADAQGPAETDKAQAATVG